jgi:hypothetical protein
MSGMRINYHKSDLMPINLPEEDSNLFAQVFCCPVGKFPFKYLGVPMHYGNLRREDIQPVIDKIIKGISGWRGKLLSYRARLILLQICIASIPLYLLSVIKFPKWAIKAMNSQMAHFFWDDTPENHKYHLANWGLICQKQEFGGMGIPNLREFNLCLLASWIKRYHLDDNKIWKKIIDAKYDLGPNIFWSNPSTCSPFWKGVMWAAHAAKLGYRWHVGNGAKGLFWEDTWIGNCCLAVAF